VNLGRKLGKASGYLFLFGFLVQKVQFLPVPVITPALGILSLMLHLAGYSLWFFSSQFQPYHKRKKEQWYGFARFKEQHLYAAALGLVATLLSIASIFVPFLIIPATWMFLISNLIWTVSEFHKLKNPPCEEKYSHTHQTSYVTYAVTMSNIALISAIATTLAFFCPPISGPVFIITAILCIGLGVIAGDRWLDFTFGDHKKTTHNSSYNHMNNSLTAGAKIESALLAEDIQPHHEQNIRSCKTTTRDTPPTGLQSTPSH